MSTPKYDGAGQPSADNGRGLLGRFGAFFGNAATPAYRPAPAKPTTPQPTDPAKAETAEVSRCGPIAIIVPRPGCVAAMPEPASDHEPVPESES